MTGDCVFGTILARYIQLAQAITRKRAVFLTFRKAFICRRFDIVFVAAVTAGLPPKRPWSFSGAAAELN